MKNLKKVLALVVALTMVLGTVCFAFTDVTAESDAYTAVQTLSSLSILKGYEDGTFGPEKDITRAEFAAVVCRALNLESSANGAKGATQFADVPADHWASGYINLAAGQGIVNGYGNGNFGPDDKVTYEQAVKMLVVALGFEPMAAQKGGYPTGYLVVANTYGMTKGVKVDGDSAAANRGIVAQLTYNALDIPVMKQTGYGTNVEFGVFDGEVNKPRTTLLTGLEVAKLDGSVVGTSVIACADQPSLAADEVAFAITDNYDDTDWKENGKAEKFVVAEGVNAADYFGVGATIYVQEVKNDWVVIAIMQSEDCTIVEFDGYDIDEVDVSKNVIKYNETPDAKKPVTLNLDDSVKVYKDNDEVTTNKLKAVEGWADDVEITAIDADGDNDYDMIIGKEYLYDVVEVVDVARNRFELKYDGKYTFDFESEDVTNTIVNAEGEAITLEDFAEGDVVAYIMDGGRKGTADASCNWCEVINLGQSVVTGAITEINENENTIYVDGVEYERAAIFTEKVKVTDEGSYYLTKTNKIFGREKDSSVSSNYAYVLQTGKGSGFDNGWQFKLLTKEGDITIFDVKDNFTIDGTSFDNEADAIAGFEKFDDKAVYNDIATLKDRVITYKLDTNNKIREINTLSDSKFKTIGDPTKDPAEKVKYNAEAIAIANTAIADNAVVFNLSGKTADDAFVTGASSLVHESEYAGYLAKSDDEFDAFFVTDGKGAIDYSQDLAIVESVNEITHDDDTAWRVRYYVAGEAELKELTVTSETDAECTTDAIKVVMSGNKDANKPALAKGDSIMFAANDEGIAESIVVIARANNSTNPSDKAYVINEDAAANFTEKDELQFVRGYIIKTERTSKGINITYYDTKAGKEDMITVKSAANGYTYYNRTASKVSIEVGDWQAVPEIDEVDGQTKDQASYFYAIVESGLVSDIITFSTTRTYK